MKFPIKGFFTKCDQVNSFLRIWLHLRQKSLMKNFIFVQCSVSYISNKDLTYNKITTINIYGIVE